jgi:hypothetical protein
MEFDLMMNQQGFIASQVLPVVEVAKQSGSFGKIPIEQLLKHPDTRRAPGSGYSRDRFTFTTDTFACEENGMEEPVDDREATMYNEYFDAEVIAAQRAMHAVMSAYELRVAAAVFNATTWTSYTTGITNEWDDYANAVPLTDVESAVQAVYTQCGLWPNALIVNRKVYRNLRNCAQIVDRVKYQGFMDARAGNISQEALSQAFDLQLIVAGGTQNTANEGQSASLSPTWSDEYAMVCKLGTSNDIREPCIGRTFHWGEDGSSIGGTVESYREENIRGDIIRVRHDVDEKILYAEAGHLLSNVTT